MAMRKVKPKTIYPPPAMASRIEAIASDDPGATFNYWAIKLMTWGLKKHDRIQAKKAQLQRA